MEDFNIDSKGVNDPFSFDTGDVNEKKDKKYFVLIIYDISDNKRRYQMVKALLSFGFRVQKSAFEAMLKPAKYKKLIEKIKDIPAGTDSLRIYKLYGQGFVEVYGENYTISDEEVIII